MYRKMKILVLVSIMVFLTTGMDDIGDDDFGDINCGFPPIVENYIIGKGKIEVRVSYKKKKYKDQVYSFTKDDDYWVFPFDSEAKGFALEAIPEKGWGFDHFIIELVRGDPKTIRENPLHADFQKGIVVIEPVLTTVFRKKPILDPIGDKSTSEGKSLSFKVNVSNKVENPIKYGTNTLLPRGARLNSKTGQFIWTPGYDQAGIYEIMFQAKNGNVIAKQRVKITVRNTNQAPVLAAIGNKTIKEGDALSFKIRASDPDGDALTYNAPYLPGGARLNSQTGKFSWTPGFNQAGSYRIEFRVGDGNNGTAKQYVIITVGNKNRAPVLAAIGDKTVYVYEGSYYKVIDNQDTYSGPALSFTISASDPDGDALSYSAAGLPDGASFNSVTRKFQWSPTPDQVGEYLVTFKVSDGNLTTEKTIKITVIKEVIKKPELAPFENPAAAKANQAPVLEVIGNRTVNLGETLSFTISASDPDGDALTYSAAGLPNGASFDSVARKFQWSPSFSQIGEYTVTFQVSDGYLTDSKKVKITVYFSLDGGGSSGHVNRPPVLAAIGNQTVNEGDSLTFTISASDPNGDALTYSAAGLPNGAGLNNQTGEFQWTPTGSQVGEHTVAFQVSDGILIDAETITITVNNVNQAPVLAAIGNQTVNEGNPLTFTVSASDPDGDALTYSAAGLPSGASLNNQTGKFQWTLTGGQVGNYSVTFQVSDGQLSDKETITITINNVNQTPVLAAIGNQTVNAGDTLTFTVSASDPDGDALTYSAAGLPNGAGLNNQTGEFQWTPAGSQVGEHTVTFQVSDGKLTDEETIKITVNKVNQAPQLYAIGNQSVNEGGTLTFMVSAHDPEGDVLTYSAAVLPSGATFNSATGEFQWTPTGSQAADYPVTFQVSDGQLTDAETITITVN